MINKNDWEALVSKHPHGNIFQSYEYYEIHKRTFNCEPIIITVDKSDKVVGILLAIIYKEHYGFFGRFTSRSIIIGGPLIIDESLETLEILLQKYLKIIKGKVIYTQIRNQWNWKESNDIFKKYGFNYIPHLNILINVEDLNTLEKGISKNKKRNITKSKNKGLVFIEITDLSEFLESIELILSTYYKLGLPCPKKEYFITAFKELNPINRLKVFSAFLDDKQIATRIELIFNDTVYDWYAGTKENEESKYPNDFLIYNVLIWSHEHKFKIFDFGGAGMPNKPYGVREHKLKFSKNLVELGRFQIIHKPLLMIIGRIGILVLKNVKWFLTHI
ncbi:MAG TPA: GNAT family N-acetyltransferase [Bacteroidales bacterium]|nr:GNAT family N-acetyltransferase [Bacteroidales bacterium]